jgi:hypothetical protein
VRYCFENRVHEDLLFCQPLKGRTTGEDTFKKLNEFFTANDLCTDGAAAITGKKKDFLAKIQKKLNNATDVIYTHYIIHTEALAAKKIPPELKKNLARMSYCSELH